MIQEILVGIFFIGAVAYMGKLLRNNAKGSSSCASGCNQCSAVDFKKIEQQIKEKESFTSK